MDGGKQVINNEGLSKVVSAVILGLKVGHHAHVEIYALTVSPVM